MAERFHGIWHDSALIAGIVGYVQFRTASRQENSGFPGTLDEEFFNLAASLIQHWVLHANPNGEGQ